MEVGLFLCVSKTMHFEVVPYISTK